MFSKTDFLEKEIMFLKYLKNYLPYIIIIASLVFALQPLFAPGFFPMHDNEQVARLFELNKDIISFHIPPRLAQDLGFGYDYPLFNFYPAFVYYIAEIFVLLGFSFIVSTKLMIGLGFILAAIFMYLFSKEYVGKLGAMLAAIAYSYVPYHSVDVYVRGALPEFWSFVFIPALFWSYTKLQKTKESRYMIISAIFIAFFILTHNLIAMMSAVFIGLFIAYLFFQTKEKKKFITQVVISGILGLGVAAYFWIPAFFEKRYTMVDLLTSELASYNLHFVYLKQFWSSPWGYGGSVFGLQDGLSFQIGKVHLILSIVVLFANILYWFIKKTNKIFFFFVVLFLLSIFMQTEYSKFIWDHFQPFWYIQFPWRFLVISAFTVSFLLGFIFISIKNANIRIIVFILLTAVIVLFNKDYFQPSAYVTNVKDQDYVSEKTIRWYTSNLSFEYVPKGIATKKSALGNTVVVIDENGIAKSPYTVINGHMVVAVLKDTIAEKKFQITASAEGTLRVNTYSFPGWTVFLDGKKIQYKDKNPLKLIDVTIPKGVHVLDVVFQNTSLRLLGDVASLSAIFAVLFITGWSRIKKFFKKRYD